MDTNDHGATGQGEKLGEDGTPSGARFDSTGGLDYDHYD